VTSTPDTEPSNTPARFDSIAPGTSGSFEFTGYKPLEDRPVTVWYDAPEGDLTNVNVLIVMHGQGRNGEEYRDDWEPHARDVGALLIVPEFDEDFYPGADAYNIGNLVDDSGDDIPESRWTFSIIEPLFDYVQTDTGNRADGYYLFGHSAGAQFVHRFMLFKPENRVKRAVSANAGWYTATEVDVEFPYGLRGSPSTDAGLRRALAAPLTILLGEEDVDTESDSLRSTPESERQGENRLERGQFFFAAGRDAAAALGTEFAWKLETVPGAEHSDEEMAPAAARLLFR
jgi:pimeloyl-ACP methyl ester carboxylesterase